MKSLPGITLRPAENNDLSQVANLDRLAFAPLQATEVVEREWYEGSIDLPGRQIFVTVEDATELICGSYTQFDLELFFEGQEFPVMGIGGVAVALHRRGQKLARLMLEHAVESAKSRQVPLMMLYPFQHGFYRQLGWAWVEQVLQYRVAVAQLPAYPERSRILPFHPSHHSQALPQVYRQSALQHNGWLQRQDRHWQRRLKPQAGREIYVYVEAEKVLGYLIFQFGVGEPQPGQTSVKVQEWVALTPTAYRGILGFLSSLRDQVTTVIWNTDAADPFPHLLKEQWRDRAIANPPFEFGLVHRFGETGGGFMWRLVDLVAAFELRPIQPGEAFALTFQVTDPILEAQTITIEFAEGQMICMKQQASTRLKISIEHLTALFSGMRRSQDLWWTGEIELEGDREVLHQLDAAWQAAPPFCWDFF